MAMAAPLAELDAHGHGSIPRGARLPWPWRALAATAVSLERSSTNMAIVSISRPGIMHLAGHRGARVQREEGDEFGGESKG